MSHEPFDDRSSDPPVHGVLTRPGMPNGDGLVLTHGAGGNSRAPLLLALAEAFSAAGYLVLRCDMPFRQVRSFGPPRPGEATRDREGLRNAVGAMRKLARGQVFLGGQSYGGRQGSMLAADRAGLVDGLLLLSYPLHPPGKPEQLRTQHLPKLQLPVLVVQGTRDPFGAIAEIEQALKLIPGKTRLEAVEGAGHDLGFKGKARAAELPERVVQAFREMMK